MRRTVTLLAVSLAVSSVRSYGQVNLSVDARMDIYQAGGYADGSDGSPPVVLTFPPQLQGVLSIEIPSVGGAWSCHSGFPAYSADGQTSGQCLTFDGPTNVKATGPFSGFHVTDAQGALVGVFLSDTPTAAPVDLRFFVEDGSLGGTSTSFPFLSPQLGQIFYVGDGLTGTGTGTQQIFNVPASATHLYLGYAETCRFFGGGKPGCYADNSGSLNLNVRFVSYRPDWSLRMSSGPSARIGAALTYDVGSDSMFLFGGSGAFIPGPTYNDTWTGTTVGPRCFQ